MTDKKYTVQEFAEKYRKASDLEKNKLMKEINVKAQVPFAQKVVHSEAVLSQSAKRVHGVLQKSSARRYLIFTTSIIKLYTELETNAEAPHEDYDLLRETGVMDEIMGRIGNDLEEFTTVFNMVWDDMLYNENNWRTFIDGQIAETARILIEGIGGESLKKQFDTLRKK